MHEQYSHICLLDVRGHWNHSIHVIVTTGLRHQDFAYMVKVLLDILPFIKDSVSMNVRVSGDRYTNRLTTRVHLNRLDDHGTFEFVDSLVVHFLYLGPNSLPRRALELSRIEEYN